MALRGRPRTKNITVETLIAKLEKLDPKAVLTFANGDLRGSILDVQQGEAPRTVAVAIKLAD